MPRKKVSFSSRVIFWYPPPPPKKKNNNKISIGRSLTDVTSEPPCVNGYLKILTTSFPVYSLGSEC